MRIFALAIVLLALGYSSCSSGGGGGDSLLPPVLSGYTLTPASYQVGMPIADNSPTVTPNVDSFAVAPALPAGLALDTTTGVISGTPTMAMAMAVYTVTATNSAGSDTFDLDIEVVSVIVAPTSLAYAPDPAGESFTLGFEVGPISPVLGGGTSGLAFQVVAPGELPPGISLDAVSGVLSGRLLTPGDPAAFDVEVSNAGGSASTTVDFPAPDLPSARSAFALNGSFPGLSTYLVQPGGILRSNGLVPTVEAGAAKLLAASIDGALLYLYNQAANSLTGWAVDATTGALMDAPSSPLDLSGVAASASAEGIAIDPLRAYLWVANGEEIVQIVLDDATGAPSAAATPVETLPPGTSLRGIGIDPTGSYAYTTDDSTDPGNVFQFSVDRATGDLTPLSVASVTAGTEPTVVRFSPDGAHAYVLNEAGNTVSVFDVGADGALAAAQSFANPGVAPATGLTVTLDGASAYVTHALGSVSQMDVDGITGQLSAKPTSALLVGTGSRSIAVTPDSLFAYVANEGDDEVALLEDVSPGGTGELSILLPAAVTTAGGPIQLVLGLGEAPVSLDDTAVYAPNNGSDDVSQFDLAAGTGTLTPLGTPQVSTLSGPAWVEVHPRLDLALVVTSSTLQAFPIDAGGALGTPVDHVLAAGLNSVHLDPRGAFAFVVNSASGSVTPFAIDPVSGALTQGTAVTIGSVPRSGAVHPSGRFLYVPNQFDDNIEILSIDSVTGALASLGTQGLGGGATDPFAIAIDPTGRFLYTCNEIVHNLSGFQIDPTTGGLTELPGSPYSPAGISPIGARSIAVHPTGRLLYAGWETSQQITPFTINVNPTNGNTDGVLTSFAGTATTTVGTPRSLVIGSAGTFLLAGDGDATGSVEVFGVDGLNLIPVGATPTGTRTRGLGLRRRVE